MLSDIFLWDGPREQVEFSNVKQEPKDIHIKGSTKFGASEN